MHCYVQTASVLALPFCSCWWGAPQPTQNVSTISVLQHCKRAFHHCSLRCIDLLGHSSSFTASRFSHQGTERHPEHPMHRRKPKSTIVHNLFFYVKKAIKHHNMALLLRYLRKQRAMHNCNSGFSGMIEERRLSLRLKMMISISTLAPL